MIPDQLEISSYIESSIVLDAFAAQSNENALWLVKETSIELVILNTNVKHDVPNTADDDSAVKLDTDSEDLSIEKDQNETSDRQLNIKHESSWPKSGNHDLYDNTNKVEEPTRIKKINFKEKSRRIGHIFRSRYNDLLLFYTSGDVQRLDLKSQDITSFKGTDELAEIITNSSSRYQNLLLNLTSDQNSFHLYIERETNKPISALFKIFVNEDLDETSSRLECISISEQDCKFKIFSFVETNDPDTEYLAMAVTVDKELLETVYFSAISWPSSLEDSGASMALNTPNSNIIPVIQYLPISCNLSSILYLVPIKYGDRSVDSANFDSECCLAITQSEIALVSINDIRTGNVDLIKTEVPFDDCPSAHSSMVIDDTSSPSEQLLGSVYVATCNGSVFLINYMDRHISSTALKVPKQSYNGLSTVRNPSFGSALACFLDINDSSRMLMFISGNDRNHHVFSHSIINEDNRLDLISFLPNWSAMTDSLVVPTLRQPGYFDYYCCSNSTSNARITKVYRACNTVSCTLGIIVNTDSAQVFGYFIPNQALVLLISYGWMTETKTLYNSPEGDDETSNIPSYHSVSPTLFVSFYDFVCTQFCEDEVVTIEYDAKGLVVKSERLSISDYFFAACEKYIVLHQANSTAVYTQSSFPKCVSSIEISSVLILKVFRLKDKFLILHYTENNILHISGLMYNSNHEHNIETLAQFDLKNFFQHEVGKIYDFTIDSSTRIMLFTDDNRILLGHLNCSDFGNFSMNTLPLPEDFPQYNPIINTNSFEDIPTILFQKDYGKLVVLNSDANTVDNTVRLDMNYNVSNAVLIDYSSATIDSDPHASLIVTDAVTNEIKLLQINLEPGSHSSSYSIGPKPFKLSLISEMLVILHEDEPITPRFDQPLLTFFDLRKEQVLRSSLTCVKTNKPIFSSDEKPLTAINWQIKFQDQQFHFLCVGTKVMKSINLFSGKVRILRYIKGHDSVHLKTTHKMTFCDPIHLIEQIGDSSIVCAHGTRMTILKLDVSAKKFCSKVLEISLISNLIQIVKYKRQQINGKIRFHILCQMSGFVAMDYDEASQAIDLIGDWPLKNATLSFLRFSEDGSSCCTEGLVFSCDNANVYYFSKNSPLQKIEMPSSIARIESRNDKAILFTSITGGMYISLLQ